MKQSDDNIGVYNEEHPIKRILNDDREKIDIEPIDWNDM